jgi:hypothetical protein
MSEDRSQRWSLVNDGILWKKVVTPSRIANDYATRFVRQLEESVGPVDFVQGLLLDRIAANCLRQQILLDVQRETAPDLAKIEPYQRSAARATANVGSHWFVNLLKYESLLNQAFYRDLILLQTLQKAHPAASALSPQKPPQSERRLIDASADSAVANQAVGSLAATKPRSVIEGNGDNRNERNRTDEVQMKRDPDRPGYIKLS